MAASRKIAKTPAAASAARRAAASPAAPPDWRDRLVADIRRLVREADPEIEEAIKWRGATTWSHGGLVCLANTFKDTVKVIFARGAKLADPDGMFNSELAGNAWRGITLSGNDRFDGPAFKRLVRSAVALNLAAKPARRSSR
jgi:hypothetical protein